MGDSLVHRVKFYNVEPRAIHCMAYDHDHRKLAVSRADSSIEVWNLHHNAAIERVLPGRPNGSVEALAWCGDRLFSTGISARVVEYDLKTLTVKYSMSVTAGPAWCLGVNQKRTSLAVGTEDGYINIFSITSDSLQYEKILDKQEGRILCLSWDASGYYIATGSIDIVRIWNVHTGHAVHKMTTGRDEAKKETIVWCITITDDFTVISGDSRGKLCFWNGQSGINTETYQCLKADILCLALSGDQSTVYCSGVDPLISTFTRISIRNSSLENGVAGTMGIPKLTSQRSQWCRSENRRIHEHDVRALTVCHDKLCSGGIDSYLAISRPPKVLIKHPPIPQAPCVVVCPQSRCLLLRYTTLLEVWRLGSSEKVVSTIVENGFRNRQKRQPSGNTSNGNLNAKSEYNKQNLSNDSKPLQLVENPVKLLELRSLHDEHIVCAALSSDARWLTYSTESVIRLYSLKDVQENTPSLEKISPLPGEFKPTHQLKFSSDSSRLVLVSPNREILIFNLNPVEQSVTFSHSLDTSNVFKDVVHLLEISDNNQFIVAADLQSNISIWKDKQLHSSLPHYSCAPSALSISSCSKYLVVVYVDSKIVEYSVEKKLYTPFSRKLDKQHPKQWLQRTVPVINVTFDPRDPQKIILHDDNTICVVDKKKSLAPADAKSLRLDKMDGAEDGGQVQAGASSSQHAFHFIKRYKHLVYFGWLADDELVAVEVNPLRLLKELPPAFYRKRFGM